MGQLLRHPRLVGGGVDRAAVRRRRSECEAALGEGRRRAGGLRHADDRSLRRSAASGGAHHHAGPHGRKPAGVPPRRRPRRTCLRELRPPTGAAAAVVRPGALRLDLAHRAAVRRLRRDPGRGDRPGGPCRGGAVHRGGERAAAPLHRHPQRLGRRDLDDDADVGAGSVRRAAAALLLLLITTKLNASDAQLAERVRAEFLFSWRAYEQYAWGHDELRPLSKTPRDWYGQSLLITPVDSLDTLILLGFDDEAARARKLIDETLSFDKDISVKNFEITIRVLGGLLSGYELTGDKRLLELADDLGARLLPVFNSPTGMPYVNVNLKTGKISGTKSNPAEVGTLLLEFGTLSKLTHKPIYYDKAKNALVQLYKRRSKIGLVGDEIDIETGEWTSRAS